MPYPKTIFVTAVAVILLITVIVIFHHPQQPNASTVVSVVQIPETAVNQAKRKIYPFSVVPGGAMTPDEAKLAISRLDVRNLYAGVDTEHLKKEILKVDLSGYVLYRFSDGKFYWTKKKLTFRAGETVFADGKGHIVRGRCLNLYSETPMQPTRPTEEPSEKVLDTPIPIPTAASKPPAAEEKKLAAVPTVPILPPVTSTPPGKKGGGWFPIISIVPVWIHRHPEQGPPPSSPVPPPVMTVTPEPNLIWLLVAVLAVIVISRRRRYRI